MLLKNNSIHTRTRVDAIIFHENVKTDAELMVEMRQIFFVFGKNSSKRWSKRDIG